MSLAQGHIVNEQGFYLALKSDYFPLQPITDGSFRPQRFHFGATEFEEDTWYHAVDVNINRPKRKVDTVMG